MMKKAWLSTLGLCFFSLALFSQAYLEPWEEMLRQSRYPDNWKVRQQFQEPLEANSYLVREYPITIVETEDPLLPQVKYEFREVDSAHYIFFINKNPYNHFFDEQSRYDVDILGRGNWILKRDAVTGEYLQAKIFLLHRDDSSYLRITSGVDRCFLDVYLKGKLLYRHVPIGLEFHQVLYSPLSRILALTSDAIRWEEIFTDADYQEWRRLEELSQEITSSLSSMNYVDDGAMDHQGQWVFIETEQLQQGIPGVNCSGFLKWVADGFYGSAPFLPEEKEMLTIEELKKIPREVMEEEHSWTRNFEHRDPLFGLNWIRNITRYLQEAYQGSSVLYGENDLTGVPFFEYRKDIGYPLEDLEALIYLAAVNRPGQIYWGALSSQFQPNSESQALRQYHHVFLVVPWFDSNGEFHYRIFESGSEVTLEQLLSPDRYPTDAWVHFSATPGWRSFNPPELN